MKCPECGKEVKGRTCSFCGFNVAKFIEESTSDELETDVLKNVKIFKIVAVLSILVMVGSIFTYWFMPFAIILFVTSIFLLRKKLNKKISKKQYSSYWFMIVMVVLLSSVSFGEKMGELYTINHANEKYSEILDVEIPNKKPKYEYIKNLDKGYRIERFVFELSNDEINTLINSNGKFAIIDDDIKKTKIYGAWYNNIESGYIIYFDMINNRYQDIEDNTMYHYTVIIIEDEKVIVDEITKTPTKVETGESND